MKLKALSAEIVCCLAFLYSDVAKQAQAILRFLAPNKYKSRSR